VDEIQMGYERAQLQSDRSAIDRHAREVAQLADDHQQSHHRRDTADTSFAGMNLSGQSLALDRVVDTVVEDALGRGWASLVRAAGWRTTRAVDRSTSPSWR